MFTSKPKQTFITKGGKAIPIVGSRVDIWWEDDDIYYSGVISKKRDTGEKKYLVQYDDGETEWVNFDEEKYCLRPDP
jgi:tartrate dehydratase beta subunit/fumarate hydratase class I family protein